MPDANHIAALRGLIGDSAILTEPADMSAYETGARYDMGRAAFVARPASTEQVSAIVSYCVSHGIYLIPQSGNTGLVSGSTPDPSGAQGVLSLDRLIGTFELDTANRSLRVSAGLRLSELNARLEDAGLCFPIDLGADPRLGGMVATNTGGSRFLRYGDVRRNTLGLKVVLANAEGTVLDLTSELRKNNTGVDLKQLFIGTSGSFGVITECVLNLEPVQRQTATALLVPTSPESVSSLLVAMEASLGNLLSAFEGMSGNAIRAAFDHVPSLRNPFQGGTVPDYVILAEISRSNAPRRGEQSLDEVMETVLAESWEGEDQLLRDAFVGRPHEVWALRHALSEGVRHKGRLIAFDLSFRRGDVMRFVERMKRELPLNFPGMDICHFGHIGDGGIHFNLVAGKDDARISQRAFECGLRAWVVDIAVREFGGSFSAEHAIGRKNQAFYDQYTSTEIRKLAAGLKAITSPGALGSAIF
ncbi:FAD-binding oxidoreductase [Mesorhizobium australicum]|uniref:FAD-binding oxidoreductase n=1 Tax=Mesorhizobium australicum TaxID=536018 RepID=UPI00333943EF